MQKLSFKYRVAGVPGLAQVNENILTNVLYPFSLFLFPLPLFPFEMPGLHLPSLHSPFPVKVLVELLNQVFINLPIKVPLKLLIEVLDPIDILSEHPIVHLTEVPLKHHIKHPSRLTIILLSSIDDVVLIILPLRERRPGVAEIIKSTSQVFLATSHLKLNFPSNQLNFP